MLHIKKDVLHPPSISVRGAGRQLRQGTDMVQVEHRRGPARPPMPRDAQIAPRALTC